MSNQRKIEALKIKQWLQDWDDVPFGDLRKKPQPHFYIFSIDANTLKKLSKVYPRKADESRTIDIGVQRKHDPERSEKIRKYVFGGFPWSDLSAEKQKSDAYSDLKMPGWLPTAIIANIIAPKTSRGGVEIEKEDTIILDDTGERVSLMLPEGVFNSEWDPAVPPIEIIDGQHRLWAFDQDEKLKGNFELPVVAFYDLDISWQAYLFYTINIKPKKINASLAFDLYPVLRVQDWLERSVEGAFVYKETRAQELVEVLWSFNSSPWKDRISMLGERYDKEEGGIMPTITQAAFIRSLIATFVKSSSRNLGGLYGGRMSDGSPLIWNRTQQAAFLILVWNKMISAISNSHADWAKDIRAFYATSEGESLRKELGNLDPAYASKMSLISSDQGVRGFLNVINDMIYVMNDELDLNSISSPDEVKEDRIDPDDVTRALQLLEGNQQLVDYLNLIVDALKDFDWRSASTPGLDRATKQRQMIYKGSSGYKEIRSELLRTLQKSQSDVVVRNASTIIQLLGYGD